MATSDEEVSQYVLAYLLSNNYSQTAKFFMEECPYLSSHISTALVLPPLPLKNIISEYKGRQATDVLVESLGSDRAWKSLWERLGQTLTQIKNLAHGQELRKKPPSRRSKYIALIPSDKQKSDTDTASTSSALIPTSTTSISTLLPNVTPSVLSHSVTSSSHPLLSSTSLSGMTISSITNHLPFSTATHAGQKTGQTGYTGSDIPSLSLASVAAKSPRKKSQPSKRKQPESSSLTSESVVDEFLNAHHSDLPNKLAEFINLNVTGDMPLLNNLTSSDCWLDDLLDTLGPANDEVLPTSSKRLRLSDNDN